MQKTIGHASNKSGVSIETIRYYEREGIVPKPDRTSAGRRSYSDEDISRLRFIRRCRDLGFPIQDAKSLLGLTDGSQSNCSVAGAIAENHLRDVKFKIAALQKMEAALAAMTRQCSADNQKCPVLDELLAD